MARRGTIQEHKWQLPPCHRLKSCSARFGLCCWQSSMRASQTSGKERLPFLLLLWSITDTPVPTFTPPPFSSFLPTPSQCLRPDQGRADEASCLLARGLRTLTTKKDPKLQSPGKGRRWGEGEKRSRESLQGPQHTLEVRRFPAQKRDPSWAAGSHARQPHCATRHLKHTGRA